MFSDEDEDLTKREINLMDNIQNMGAEITRLRALLLECASEIESYVKAEYGWPDVHPAQQSKFDAGMSLVNDAREAAKGGKP